jgi:4-amino-4-deoxy-L-arabinose transferase-like glycosyltransferase
MAKNTKGKNLATPSADGDERHIPQGYRAGIITAITVLLGFSLTFLRFWGFEAPGKWTPRSVISTGILVLAVALQIFALFRSLRLEDDEVGEYRKTVAWFIASAVALLVGLLLAVVEFSGVMAS